MFVKPARGGSSIGVSRVTGPDDVPGAIAEARRHDPKVIIEAAIIGRELECGVLEFPDGSVNASTIGEIRVPGVGVYDFETKYLDDAAELDVPAALPDTDAKLLQDLAIRTFDALDCQGLARVDFFLTEDGPVINEINTMPGMTATSLMPKSASCVGLDFPALVRRMAAPALARAAYSDQR